MPKCIYQPAWQPDCDNDALEGKDCCEHHSKAICKVCGKQAIQECSFASSLSCGIPLCKTCKCPHHD
jgi:hypothetical protein